MAKTFCPNRNCNGTMPDGAAQCSSCQHVFSVFCWAMVITMACAIVLIASNTSWH